MPRNLEFKISYGTKLNKKDERVTLTEFSCVIDKIKNGTDGLVGKIAELCKLSTIEERQVYKPNNLPYFSMCTYHQNHRKNENLSSSQHIVFDLGHLGKKLDQVRADLLKDPRTYCLFISPSGDGIKMIYTLDRVITDSNVYKQVYEYYFDQFSKTYKDIFDDRDPPPFYVAT